MIAPTQKTPPRQGQEGEDLRNFFDTVAKMDGYKSWADLCRWDVGDEIYKNSQFLPGLFVMWYGAVILLRVMGLPLRLLAKQLAKRIQA